MNRQMGSHGNIGRIKVEALKEKYPKVTPIHVKKHLNGLIILIFHLMITF